MSIVVILAVLVLVGVVVWAAQQLPIAEPFKRLILVVAVVLVVFWLVSVILGVNVLGIRVGR